MDPPSYIVASHQKNLIVEGGGIGENDDENDDEEENANNDDNKARTRTKRTKRKTRRRGVGSSSNPRIHVLVVRTLDTIEAVEGEIEDAEEKAAEALTLDFEGNVVAIVRKR